MSWNPYARLPLRHIKKYSEDGIEKDDSYDSYIRTCSMPLAADRRGLDWFDSIDKLLKILPTTRSCGLTELSSSTTLRSRRSCKMEKLQAGNVAA